MMNGASSRTKSADLRFIGKAPNIVRHNYVIAELFREKIPAWCAIQVDEVLRYCTVGIRLEPCAVQLIIVTAEPNTNLEPALSILVRTRVAHMGNLERARRPASVDGHTQDFLISTQGN